MHDSIGKNQSNLHQLEIENKKLKEENAYLRSQLAIVQELRSELAQRTSKNSSKPPSSDFKANQSSSYNRGGAKKGHKGHVRKLLGMERVDAVQKHELNGCPNCGSQNLGHRIEAIPFQYIELIKGRCVVTQHEQARYQCCSCQKQFTAPLPLGVGPSNYGPKFHAAIGLLTGHFLLSKRQVTEFTEQFFGIPMSDGTVCKIEKRITKALSESYEEVSAQVKKVSSTKFVDETSWRDQHRNGYVWVAANKAFSFFKISYSRSKESRDELLGANYRSPTVTDRYAAYTSLKGPHQYCLAHLKRDFIKFSERKGHRKWIARGVLKQLEEAFRLWRLFQKNEISRRQLVNRSSYRRGNIRKLLEIGETESTGKFRRFCRALLERYDRLWTYLRVEDMEPTNNEAERSLRPIVLFRKKSQGTKSSSGMKYVSTMFTICQTLKKQGYKMLSFISAAMQGLQPSII